MTCGRSGRTHLSICVGNEFIGIVFIILANLIPPTIGWPYYRFAIPNGDAVPNPCEQTSIWSAVGHGNAKVYAPLNPFGNDFLKFGMVWNNNLCMTDSDGDGRSNGEELGDPTCEWRQSSPTPLLPAVSHPGICEPTDSNNCLRKPNSFTCPGAKKFECPAFLRNDTVQFNVTMTRTHVPVGVSSYVCLEVRLPSDQDYHLLAAKPTIDKDRIVDQIQIFACDAGMQSRVYNHPFECGEKPRGDCQSLIGGFSKDEPGICFPPNTGYAIGASGCKQIIFQIRYNNPFLNEALYDSSGVILFYTSNLQQLELGTKLISVTHFTIPSGSRNAAITAEYPQQCSATQISQQVFITGRKQRVELVRNDILVETVAETSDFEAHNLKGNHLKSPIRILPGDSIRIVCWYDTTSAKTPITWGLLSTNEMCSASLLYYPRLSWQQATGTSFKTIPLCKLQTTGEVNGCQFGRLFEAVRQNDVTTSALAYCAAEKVCTSECASISSIAFNHPCLNGENYELLQSRLTRKFQNLKNFMDTLQLCDKSSSNSTSVEFSAPGFNALTTVPPGNYLLSNFSEQLAALQNSLKAGRSVTGHVRPIGIYSAPSARLFRRQNPPSSTLLSKTYSTTLEQNPTSPDMMPKKSLHTYNTVSPREFQNLPLFSRHVDITGVHSVPNTSPAYPII